MVGVGVRSQAGTVTVCPAAITMSSVAMGATPPTHVVPSAHKPDVAEIMTLILEPPTNRLLRRLFGRSQMFLWQRQRLQAQEHSGD